MAKTFVVGDRALELLKMISFPRVSGSLEEKKAAEILTDEITSIGFDVKKEGFTITRKYPVKAELYFRSGERYRMI